ncbi:MAG: hypothetical protein ACFFB3_00990 [Candidatus Hodarchaeota archaeon]
MPFPPIPIILVIVQAIGFCSAIILMMSVYLRHRFLSHLLLALAFTGMLFFAILRFFVNFVEENEDLARASWQVQNVFLILGILLIFWAFIYFQHHEFPFYTNLVSLWGGATILVYTLPDFTKMEFDELFGWNATYDPLVSVFAAPLIIFFIFAFIRPIIAKMKSSANPKVRKTGYLLIVSFSGSLLWGLLSAFTIIPMIRVFRAFILPLAWLLWAWVTWRNPLSLIFTDAKMNKILIATEAGVPVLYYDFKKRCSEDATVATGILTALTSSLSEVLSPAQTQDSLSSIRYQEQVVAVRSIKEGFLFFGFSQVEDPGLSSAFSVFIQQFVEIYGEHLKKVGIIQSERFESAAELAEEVFSSIYLLETSTPV